MPPLKSMAITNPDGAGLTQARENFLWLVADKCLRLLAGVAVTMLVAQYLGPSRYGLLTYATSFVAILLPLADLGVEAVVRRRLIKVPADAPRWLALVWRVRLGAGALLSGLLLAWLTFFHARTVDALLISILSLTLLQPAGMTADMWLQANLMARRATLASWMALSFGAMARLYLVHIHGAITAFAWVAVSEGALNCLFVWLAARQAGLPKRVSGIALAPLRELMAESWPLLLAGITVMFYMRIDLVMLRNLSGEHAAGVYAAAVRLSELWYFVPSALATSLLPGLLLKRAEGEAAYTRALRRYYDLSAALAYTAALTICLLAGPLVRLTYGAEFLEAIPVLRWHAWAVVFVFLGVARSQFLVNEGMAGFHLAATSAGALVNVALNAWLIPAHGPLGAAWATLAAYGLAAWGASWLHPRLRANAVLQTRALLVPLFGWRYLFRQ